MTAFTPYSAVLLGDAYIRKKIIFIRISSYGRTAVDHSWPLIFNTHTVASSRFARFFWASDNTSPAICSQEAVEKPPPCKLLFSSVISGESVSSTPSLNMMMQSPSSTLKEIRSALTSLIMPTGAEALVILNRFVLLAK